jgi:hypothetical protein
VYQPPPPPAKQVDVDEIAWGVEFDDENQLALPVSTVMNADLGRYVMEQTIAKLLFHAGFEGTVSNLIFLISDFQSSAFDVITGVAIEYLQDIGRTLRLYINNNDARQKFSEEVVLILRSLMLGTNYACLGFKWSRRS